MPVIPATREENCLNPEAGVAVSQDHAIAKETKELMHSAQTSKSESTKLPTADERPSPSSTCLFVAMVTSSVSRQKLFEVHSLSQILFPAGRFISAVLVMQDDLTVAVNPAS